jgi:hypothetical protein
LGLVAVIVAVAVSVGLVWLLLRGDRGGSNDAVPPATTATSTTDGPPTTPPTDPAPGPWDVSPPMPLEPRVGALVAWTGSELVIWGGVDWLGPLDEPARSFSDGAALDPVTGTWRVMATSPLPELAADRVDELPPVRGVMTAAGLLVVRDTGAALWDPTTDAWTSIAPAPVELVELWESSNPTFEALATALVDLQFSRWRALPDPPVALSELAAAWTGDELVVVGRVRGDPPVAVAYRPDTSSWRQLPDPPSGIGRFDLTAGWDGERVVVVGGALFQSAAYDPTGDRWEMLAGLGMRSAPWFPVPVDRAGPYSLLFFSDAILLLDDDLWRPVPYGGVDANHVVGRARLDAVRGPGESTVLVPFIEPVSGRLVVMTMDVLEELNRRRITLGPITFDVPDRYSPSRANRWDDGQQAVDLQQGMASCSVMARPFEGDDDAIGPEVAIDHDGTERIWTRHELRQGWQFVGEGVAVFVNCADPDAAEAVVRSVRLL